MNLTLVSADEWEQLLRAQLWSAIDSQVFEQILMPASSVDNAGSFNTLIDIKLKHWAEKELPSKSVQVLISFFTVRTPFLDWLGNTFTHI